MDIEPALEKQPVRVSGFAAKTGRQGAADLSLRVKLSQCCICKDADTSSS
jgi:hypothetical protein